MGGPAPEWAAPAPDGHYASRAFRMVAAPVGWVHDADH